MISFTPKTATSWASRRLNFQQKLFTLDQARKIPNIYAQDGKGLQATAYVKYFCGGLTWFATEFDPDNGQFYGYVFNHSQPEFSELGYFSADELCSRPYPQSGRTTDGKLRVIPAIERDIHFKPCTIAEAIEQLTGSKPEPAEPAKPEWEEIGLSFYKSDFAD